MGAAAVAAKLGFPTVNGRQTFVFGYGEGQTSLDPFTGTYALGTPVRIFENYLVGEAGFSTNWLTWNTDANGDGAFVNVFFDQAKAGGAVPMFTIYQLFEFNNSTNGGIGCLADKTCMTNWWAAYKIVLTRVASYNLPAIANIEPDLSGYAQNQAKNNDPTTVTTQVASVESECSGLPNNLVGFASCILQLRTTHAPKLLIGFDPSDWLGYDKAVTFMKAMGIGKADVTIVETLDRDVGCFEANGNGCSRSPSPTYWADADFQAHLTEAKAYHDGFGLPLLWWQTPLGVPSTTPGRNTKAAYGYRDNRVSYFFKNVQSMIDVGGLGVVFGQGQTDQTDIQTDIMPDGSHQLKTALTKYNASPLPLN
jgi:hypothetical protein